MAGQIIKRGERTWMVRIFLGRDVNGKRRYHNRTVRGTKKDAERYRNAVLREMDLGTFIEPSSKALNPYLDEWLGTTARRVSERTFRDYEGLLARYVRPALGDRRLSDLSPMDLQSFYSELQDRGLSARTVRYTHAVLASALKQAVKWRMLSGNPADFVDLPRQVRREMQVLSPEECERFLAAASMNRWEVIFKFALATGMRPGEYLALPWKAVDLRTGSATVQRALTQTKHGWKFAEPKTRQSRRTVPLPVSVTQALKEHKRQQQLERQFAGPEWVDLDLVFASQKGRPLNESNLLKRYFRPVLKVAGLSEKIRLHDLRHTCATLLLLAGENPKVVSERLGHASVAITLDTYSHVLPSMQRSAAEKLEMLLFGGHGNPKEPVSAKESS